MGIERTNGGTRTGRLFLFLIKIPGRDPGRCAKYMKEAANCLNINIFLTEA